MKPESKTEILIREIEEKLGHTCVVVWHQAVGLQEGGHMVAWCWNSRDPVTRSIVSRGRLGFTFDEARGAIDRLAAGGGVLCLAGSSSKLPRR